MGWTSYYAGKPESCHEHYMNLAIEEAKQCAAPKKFGAVVVYYGSGVEGRIIGKAHSTVLEDHDPTMHAELKAIGMACRAVGNNRLMLKESTLYTTCEPCLMCAAAMKWAHIEGLVYGIQRGQSPHNFLDSQPWHQYIAHSLNLFNLHGGVLADKCLELMPPPPATFEVTINRAMFDYEWPNI